MDSKTVIANRSTVTGANAIAISDLPRDIIEEILDHLSAQTQHPITPCSLISRSWVTPCQQRLFRTIRFTWTRMESWLKAFPVPEKTPAHHVRALEFSSPGPGSNPPEKFLDHIQWFTNVRAVVWMGETRLWVIFGILAREFVTSHGLFNRKDDHYQCLADLGGSAVARFKQSGVGRVSF